MRWIVFIVIISCSALKAQFISADIKISGLTCSTCQESAKKALAELPFIETVTPDLKNASFKLTFKKYEVVDPVMMQTKIETAGFSIEELKLRVDLKHLTKISNSFFLYGNYYFNVLSDIDSEHGVKDYKVLDKEFVSEKEYISNALKAKFKCVYKPDSGGCTVKNESNFPIIHISSE